jgi:hypothetical protein
MAFELSRLRLNYFGPLAVFKMQDHLPSQAVPTDFELPKMIDLRLHPHAICRVKQSSG